jgi:uncharacterized 2Fe-2S/4Fe-4S cluster protein (DUF4445 family)
MVPDGVGAVSAGVSKQDCPKMTSLCENNMPDYFEIDLQPIGRHTEISAEQTLLDAAQNAGVELVAVCGGTGTCATCRVRIMSGEVTPVTGNEEFELSAADLAAGYRLACQVKPLSVVRLDIPPESLTTPQRTQVEGREVEIDLDPVVQPIDVQLPAPDLFDLRSDVTRLQESLGDAAVSIEYAALTDLSDRLRHYQWSARLARRNSSIIAALPRESRLIGLAVDVGTTKLAAYLVDLEQGHTVAKLGAMNPQIAYGEDVVSRIAYANRHADGRATLQRKLIETLNISIGEMCREADLTREQIVEAVIVGNTAMHHLLAGLPVHQLGTSPYVAAISDALEVRARDIGLEIAPGAAIYFPPNIAGFVGADHVAMLLATDIWNTDKTVVALDIGTNTEITVAHRGQLVCCSCASGPAFEGAHITAGMRAAPGAIERVQISDGDLHVHTIGQQPPVGICGSGILDAIAEMLKAELLNSRGILNKDHPRVRTRDNKSEFVLTPAMFSGHGRDVTISRSDVNEIQLAKSAIRVGIDVLLAECGITAEAIDEFVVAGAFGTYLDLNSAIRIGMFPDLPRERFQQVGNAAGTGARQMLVSAQRRRLAQDLGRRDRYIELTTYPDFTRRYVAALYF